MSCDVTNFMINEDIGLSVIFYHNTDGTITGKTIGVSKFIPDTLENGYKYRIRLSEDSFINKLSVDEIITLRDKLTEAIEHYNKIEVDKWSIGIPNRSK